MTAEVTAVSWWMATEIARQRQESMRDEASRLPRLGSDLVGRGSVGAKLTGGAAHRVRSLQVWAGYRLIALGCRLARRAVVVGARSAL